VGLEETEEFRKSRITQKPRKVEKRNSITGPTSVFGLASVALNEKQDFEKRGWAKNKAHITQRGNMAEVARALAAHADLDLFDRTYKYELNGSMINSDMTLMIWACVNNHHESVQKLVKHGADMNLGSSRRKDTPLYWASWRGHSRCVKILLDSKADPNKANKRGFTPLHRAQQEGHHDVIKLLKFYGAVDDTLPGVPEPTQEELEMAELEGLWARAIKQGIHSELQVQTMRENVARNMFTCEHFINLLREKMGLELTVKEQERRKKQARKAKNAARQRIERANKNAELAAGDVGGTAFVRMTRAQHEHALAEESERQYRV
jgi:hypothetical protein